MGKEETKPCVFCGKKDDFLMFCPGVCLECGDKLQTEHGLMVVPVAGQKEFPMLDGPSIPWSLAEKIYERYSKRYPNDQTLQRISERGGFGWAEVPNLFARGKR